LSKYAQEKHGVALKPYDSFLNQSSDEIDVGDSVDEEKGCAISCYTLYNRVLTSMQ